MEQVNMTFPVDAVQKRDFERLCRDVGLSVDTVFGLIVKQAVQNHELPLSMKGDKNRITEEDLRRAQEEFDAGMVMEVSMEELEAMEREGPDGPTFLELERRHQELKARLREWRAAKGLRHE